MTAETTAVYGCDGCDAFLEVVDAQNNFVEAPEKNQQPEKIEKTGGQSVTRHQSVTHPSPKRIEVGSKVGKLNNGRKATGWVGIVRAMDKSSAQVWWQGDYDRTKQGRIVKNSDGTSREKLTRIDLAQLLLLD
ncbi:MAG: hypothetical protein ICV63_04225 [Coleofasciculus sp. Co-bin14]|nr:hypothetical protein [Coleofasciculus sp. Co-bin14]